MASTSLPETYKAIVVAKPGQPPKIDTLPLPKPGTNQVLVKVAFAPINPSDIATMFGRYDIGLSNLVGLEGSGTIVTLGDNLKVPHKVGDRVHLRGPGTMGEYLVSNSENVWAVQDGLSLEEAASHLVNPGTVHYMAHLATQGGHKAVIHTAGSSALGRMVIRYFKLKGIKTINIVRRDDFNQELKDEGADYVLNSQDADFEVKFKEIAQKEQATLAFDAIGGDFPAKVLAAQPSHSICYVYGALSGQRVINGINLADLFRFNQLAGLHLSLYLEELAKTGKLGEAFKEIRSLLPTIFKSNIQKVFKLDQVQEALAYYEKNSSKGKILIQS